LRPKLLAEPVAARRKQFTTGLKMNKRKLLFYLATAAAVFAMLALHDWLENYLGTWKAFAVAFAPFLVFSFFMNRLYPRL
jgi:Flp pilus assembly protein TadB